MYKTLTGIIAKRISTHLEEQSLLPAEQKGCHPGSKGCKDQLTISKAIYEDCKRRNKNLSIASIDYQKAFNSVPHSWVEKSITLVGVNSKIVRFYELSMEKWNTRFFFKNKAGNNAVITHSDVVVVVVVVVVVAVVVVVVVVAVVAVAAVVVVVVVVVNHHHMRHPKF